MPANVESIMERISNTVNLKLLPEGFAQDLIDSIVGSDEKSDAELTSQTSLSTNSSNSTYGRVLEEQEEN